MSKKNPLNKVAKQEGIRNYGYFIKTRLLPLLNKLVLLKGANREMGVPRSARIGIPDIS